MLFSVFNNENNISIEIANDIFERLSDAGWIHDEIEPDYLFIVGGDGTLLKAIQSLRDIIDKVKVITINGGNLGIFSLFNDDNYITAVDDVLAGNYETKKISLLEVNVPHKETLYCLNEIKVINNERPISFSMNINGQFLQNFRGTGISVSTSWGSTGVNKSLGGAIILDEINNLWQIVEMAPINNKLFSTLNSPLIFSYQHKLELKNINHNNVNLVIDAQTYSLDQSSLTIAPSTSKLRLVTNKHCSKNSFVQIVNQKVLNNNNSFK
ncbi:NAD(+)/NADH kinase [Spiroplasma endosymbiont of Anurida maritima]|uniref:NAD(+)/NADH kinase n=1 Tax=Spiroplasma endosymbiont of Anurida maritima TaxID=2967972 RepID=UPI0036D36546